LRYVPGHKPAKAPWTEERKAAFRAKFANKKRPESVCKKMSETMKRLGIRPSKEATAKGNANRPIGRDHPRYKGFTIYPNGYRLLRMDEHPRAHPNGFVYEHIVVAEQKLGRPLKPGEVVHHVDENKLNNDPDNLEVVTRSEHARLHMKSRHQTTNTPLLS
jgi:hypothetical protein